MKNRYEQCKSSLTLFVHTYTSGNRLNLTVFFEYSLLSVSVHLHVSSGLKLKTADFQRFLVGTFLVIYVCTGKALLIKLTLRSTDYEYLSGNRLFAVSRKT